MKRLWIGVGLLTIMLILGLLTPKIMENALDPVQGQLENTAQAAALGDWEKAFASMDRAYKLWEEKRRITAALMDHDPMEEIDAIFSQLRQYLQYQDPAAVSSLCASLLSQLDAMTDYHRLTLWNIL